MILQRNRLTSTSKMNRSPALCSFDGIDCDLMEFSLLQVKSFGSVGTITCVGTFKIRGVQR